MCGLAGSDYVRAERAPRNLLSRRPDIAKLEEQQNEKGLTRALRNKDPEIRVAAAKALTGMMSGPESTEALAAALDDPSAPVRLAAVEALERRYAVVPLIRALKDADSDVRARAASSLWTLGDSQALEPLIGALVDDDPTVRGVAAKAVGALDGARGVEALAGVLRDPVWPVRLDGVEALAMTADAAAVEPLTAALRDSDARVRKAAEEALEERGAGDAQLWLELLRSEGVGIETRELAAGKLMFSEERKERADIRDPLFELLQSEQMSEETRTWAALRLGHLEDQRAVAPLLTNLEQHRGDRGKTLVALHRLGVLDDERWAALLDAETDSGARIDLIGEVVRIGETVVPLVHALGDRDPEVRAAAAASLGKIGQPPAAEAREGLIRALDDEDPGVRKAAIDAVGAVGGPHLTEAVEPLVRVLGDKEGPELRAAARTALDAIDDPRAFEAVGPAVGDHYSFKWIRDHPDDPRLVVEGRWEGTIAEMRLEGKGAPEARVRIDEVEGDWPRRGHPGELGSMAKVSLPLPVGAERDQGHSFWRGEEPDAEGHYTYNELLDQQSRS